MADPLRVEIVVIGRRLLEYQRAELVDGECARLLINGQIVAEIDAAGVVRRWIPTPPRNRGGHYRRDPGD